jgi:hypothetical protein
LEQVGDSVLSLKEEVMKLLPVVLVAVSTILAGGGPDLLLAAEREGASGAATYRSAGRRDPFVRPGSAPGAEVRTCPARGLEGARTRELALRGIVRTPEGFLALLVGPNAVAYVARVDDRLCDARIASIDPEGVTFEKDAARGSAASGPRAVRVRLHAE